MLIAGMSTEETTQSAALPDSEQDPLIGEVLFNDFLILEKVGSGLTSFTYKARQQTKRSYVALRTPRLQDREITSEFVEAATAHMSLAHENVVESLGLHQTTPDSPFYVMQWLEGVSLLEAIKETGSLADEEEIAHIFLELCNGLEHAHSKDVVHGNLVSSNAILNVEDRVVRVKLKDFGFFKVEKKLERLLAPDADDRDLDFLDDVSDSPLWLADQKKNDILMLANLLIGLVSGEPVPESQPDVDAPVRVSLAETCPDLPAAQALDAVLDEAMEPDLDWRFESVAEFREAFQGWLEAAREERKSGPTVASGLDSREDTDSQAVSVDDLLSDVEEERKRKRRRQRTGGVKASIIKMVELKQIQAREEGKFTTQFSDVMAKQKPRQSPGRALATLIAQLVAAVSLFILAFTYLVLHWDKISENWTDASMKLSASMTKDGSEAVDSDEDLEEEQEDEDEDKKPEVAKTAKAGTASGTTGAANYRRSSKYNRNRNRTRKFRYKESPSYSHWIITEVGKKRRLDKEPE